MWATCMGSRRYPGQVSRATPLRTCVLTIRLAGVRILSPLISLKLAYIGLVFRVSLPIQDCKLK